MKKFLLPVIISVFFAQNTIAGGEKSSFKKIPLSFNYIGDIEFGNPIKIYPGFSFDGGFRLMGRENVKGKSSRAHENEFFLKPGFSFMSRKHYYNGILFSTGLSYRSTFPSGLFLEANFNPGYLLKKYNDDVYELKDGVFTKSKAHDNNLYLGGDINIGVDFSKKKEDSGLGIIAGLGMFYRYPNNTSWVKHQYVKVGIIYTIRKAKF